MGVPKSEPMAPDKKARQMSYIRIANKAENVNRLYLEKLGLSTKRDDENTIGQFGSGSKFAPIAALRNGWEWINVGTDDIGDYKMQYVIQEDSGIDCIFYLYDDEHLKPSSFTADAGVLSWDSEFQIFREAFSNALDEFIAFGNEYSIDIVDEVKNVPGEFAVYITAAPELLAIVRDFDKYFAINRKPVVDDILNVKIYTPYDDSVNFYYKGVLVHSEHRQGYPLFNYELSNVTLNEERRVRDTYSLYSIVAAFFCRLTASNKNHVLVAEKMIHNIDSDHWEWSIPQYLIGPYGNSQSAFVEAWNNIYGDKVAVEPEMLRFKTQFAIRNIDYQVVDNPFMYAILKHFGVKTLHDVVGDEIDYDFITISGERVDMLDKALNIVRDYFPLFDTIVNELKVFIPQGSQDTIYGVANMNTNNVYLSVNAFQDIDTLIATLVHEYDHLASGYHDEDAAFRSVADRHIAKFLLMLSEMEAS